MQSCGSIGDFQLYDVTDIMRRNVINSRKCKAEGVAFYPEEFPDVQPKQMKYDFVDVTDELREAAKKRQSGGNAVYQNSVKQSKVSKFFKSIKDKAVAIKDSYKDFVENDKIRKSEQKSRLENDRAIFKEKLAAMETKDAPKPKINAKKVGDLAMSYVENFARGLDGMFKAIPGKSLKL